jgi:ADP-ribosylglycohydrolase
LSKVRRGIPARESGGRGERENGNGSLMRVLPLVLWHRGSDESLVEDNDKELVQPLLDQLLEQLHHQKRN